MIFAPQCQTVFDWWRELTGQHIRIPGLLQQRQAFNLHTGFTREDLEITVRYIRHLINEAEGSGRGGMSALSLQWRCFFGNDEEITTFQDRWNLAQQWAARKRQPVALAPEPVVEPSLYQNGAAAMAETLRRLKGGA